jgi:hypothetical protein
MSPVIIYLITSGTELESKENKCKQKKDLLYSRVVSRTVNHCKKRAEFIITHARTHHNPLDSYR